MYRKKLDALLNAYGITGLSEAETLRLNRAWHRCTPWPGVAAGVTRLKGKYVLSTLSNGDVACLVNMARYGGLPTVAEMQQPLKLTRLLLDMRTGMAADASVRTQV
jgi:hypothetical protein